MVPAGTGSYGAVGEQIERDAKILSEQILIYIELYYHLILKI